MPPNFYNLGDQAIYSAGDFFIPQERFRAAPYNVNTPTAPDDPAAAGLPAIYQPRGGDDIRGYESFTPDFTRRGVFADPKEYGPGGMYEINPAALGFEFGPQGQVMRAGPTDDMQGQLAASSTNPQILSSNLDLQVNRVAGIPLRDIADMYDARMQQVPGQDFRNFLKRFTGAQSNFADARVPGMVQNLGVAGILSNMFGPAGDKSDMSRFAVDNAGYGQGTGRDQFGVFTGGKTLFGDTANYTERMQNEIADIAKNFGYSVDDLMGLDPSTLTALGARNKFRQTQVIDYVNKLRAKNLEAKYQKELEERNRAEAAAAAAGGNRAAQERQRQADQARVDRAYREETGGQGGSYATGESGVQSDGSYNDPFDPGGGEKDGGFIDGTNRRMDFMMGGLADLVDIYD